MGLAKIYRERYRSDYLENLKYLREYHSAEPDEALLNEVITYLQAARGSVTVESLLQALCPTADRQLYIAPAIWYLLATKHIVANLKKPLEMKTKLSLPKE